MHPHEEAIVRAFIAPAKRARFMTLLSRKKRRRKALEALNHLRDLDERYCSRVPPSGDVVEMLRARGAPDTCYVMSDIKSLDGREVSLDEAIRLSETEGWGTLIGCIPGRLAYYYGEGGEERIILEKRVR